MYKLEESGLGCNLYNVYCGMLMYADNVLLLCSSITKLQLMVDICVSFDIEMGVAFSLLESDCVVIYLDKNHFPSSSIQLSENSMIGLISYVTLVFLLLTILKICLI